MRVVHWTLYNGSGLNRASTCMAVAERGLGLDSCITYTNPQDIPKDYTPITDLQVISQAEAMTSDVHVIHSYINDGAKGKTVFIPHGTPEHCFTIAINQFNTSGYVGGDPMMLSFYQINHCDATVTFWERHAAIWKSMSPKARVETVPMGVDTLFWRPVTSIGRWEGEPSLFTCENCHQIKWPLDLIFAYPDVMKETPNVRLHMHYLPTGLHRFWYPLMAANGTLYKSFSSGNYYKPEELRNAFVSSDYYLSLVRYGDFNTITLEAKASGAKVISYEGNPYADYWVREGDQRRLAQDLIAIIKGEAEKRTPIAVVDLKDTATMMKGIYESL